MRLQLAQRWADKLASLPESGMGYQHVRIHLKTGRTIDRALVYNASVLEVADDVPPFTAQDIDDIEMTAEEAGRSE